MRNMNTVRIFSVIVLLISTTFLTLGQNKGNRGYHVSVGDSVPDFTLLLLNGDSVSMHNLRGYVVVLQFTASWCSVCRKEMPHLESEVWQRFKNNDFLLVGVDYDEPVDKVFDFKKQMKITYPMAIDPGANIFSLFAYKNSGVTRNVVIDKTGHIAYLTRLYDREEFQGMIRKIEELLQKP